MTLKDFSSARLLRLWGSFGSKTAITQGAESVTYSDLAGIVQGYRPLLTQSKSRRIAIVDRGDIVDRVRYLAAVQNCVTVVPLSPRWPKHRVEYILESTGVDMLFDSGASAAGDGWRIAPDEAIGGSVHLRETDRSEIDSHADPAYILFTSGSTGTPKGVPVPRSALLAFCQDVVDQSLLSFDDRVSATFAMTFDVSVFDLVIPSIVGATSVVPQTRTELVEVQDYVTSNSLSVWFSVPSAIDVADRLGSLKPGSMHSLRRSMFIGEQLSMQQAFRWYQAAPSSELRNVYGPTEATVACASFTIPAETITDEAFGPVPIGHPFSTTRFKIGSTRHQQELLISGAQVFSGYLSTSDDDEVFEEAAGFLWYRSGDLVRETGAGLEFQSRIDRQIKRSGYRIELGEIEAVFLRAGASHAHASLHGDELVLVIAGQHVDRGMIERSRSTLPQYMWPTKIHAVDELPMNANGKVDVRALTRHVQSIHARDDGS